MPSRRHSDVARRDRAFAGQATEVEPVAEEKEEL